MAAFSNRIQHPKYLEDPFTYSTKIQMATHNDECEMELTPSESVEFYVSEDSCPQTVKYRECIRRAYEAASQEIARKEETAAAGPPAPPSTPTMLTPTNNLTSGSVLINNNSTYDYMKERVSNILHLLDFSSPPHKSTNHKEPQGAEVELSDLLNDVSINGNTKTTTTSKSHAICTARTTSLTREKTERSICSTSRSIRKHRLSSINAALQRVQNQGVDQSESVLQHDDEDSVSAPEFVEENFRRKRRLNRLRLLKRYIKTKRQQQRMDSMVDMFHGGMSFNDV